MAPSTDSTYRIERLEQFQALASPVRSQVLWRLASIGPASVAEVAAALGRKPQSLYPHFEALREVGLVLHQSDRHTGRRHEAVYATPARNMLLVYDATHAEKRQALWETVAAGSRNAMRSFQRRLLSGQAQTRGQLRDTHYSNLSAWVSDAELEQINQHLDAIQDLLQRPKQSADMKLMACMALLYRVDQED